MTREEALAEVERLRQRVIDMSLDIGRLRSLVERYEVAERWREESGL